MKSDCAVCYVTDRGFLFPTIASCLSLREFWGPDQGDVFVFLTDSENFYAEILTERFVISGIKFISVNSDLQDRINERDWNKTHVSKSTLGRFLIADLLPQRYTRLLYLDGDTITVGDPTSLLEFDPGIGHLATAEDISSLCRNDWGAYGRFVRTYLDGIGISGNQGYFNAGVFMVQTSTWRAMAAEALEFFLQNMKACLFHDQSAMNAVLGSRRKRLSLAWNFQTPFRYFGIENSVRPVIYHFSQSAKPWTGRVSPWKDFYDRFAVLSNQLSDLGLPDVQLPANKIRAINRSSFAHQLKLNTVFRGRLNLRKAAVDDLEHNSVLRARN